MFTPTEPPDVHRSFPRDTNAEGLACQQLGDYQTIQGRKREPKCASSDGYRIVDGANAVCEYVDAFVGVVWSIPETYTVFDGFERCPDR
jgi:hypothetical protein